MDFHPLTGDLYAAVQRGAEHPGSNPPTSTLAILDPLGGTFTIVGAIDSNGVKLDGIAFVVTAPEPGTIALMAIGLAGIGFSRRKTKV